MRNFSAAVCGHVDREIEAFLLSIRVFGQLALDEGDRGSNVNHDIAWHKAYEHAVKNNNPWCLVLEDDTVIQPSFEQELPAILNKVPPDGICSLYTGTSRPPQYQERINQALSFASLGGATFLRHTYLLWGVAVAIPTNKVPDMLGFVQDFPKLPYDYRIGEWMVARGLACYYTVPSIVDHYDGPTLIDHPDKQLRTQPRKAWSVGSPLLNGLHVDL